MNKWSILEQMKRLLRVVSTLGQMEYSQKVSKWSIPKKLLLVELLPQGTTIPIGKVPIGMRMMEVFRVKTLRKHRSK